MAREAGFQTVSVSFQGLEAAHDLQRGVQGAFRTALAAIDNLRAVGIGVSVNSQIGRAGMTDMEPLTELLMDHGIHSWQPSLTVPLGGPRTTRTCCWSPTRCWR